MCKVGLVFKLFCFTVMAFGEQGKDVTVSLVKPVDEGRSLAQHQAIGDEVEITCFTEDVNDVTLHFQIIRLRKQIYVWIGCNSAKFGNLYAASTTRPNNMVSVASVLGGAADNTGSSIAHRLVLKTGLNIVLACNIPKNSPMLEADAEKKLFQKLRALGYTSSQ
ncbi:proteasome assembly chaperone 4 isoform X1 [Cinnamomum micranthum f. kanehirae]|uniref:Proteasome assembly chaperone 4 isoform X1 n=1 Tax=Cinnamomum micranthum f. kanehirae TaxID=337451 RepID=A0A3S3NVE9_9MAGN|nr:proteasome assembly chaperone 4 isoform X1 [Cinnamomum micranthum f. kanehirae]